jgi:purine nucleoside permease
MKKRTQWFVTGAIALAGAAIAGDALAVNPATWSLGANASRQVTAQNVNGDDAIVQITTFSNSVWAILSFASAGWTQSVNLSCSAGAPQSQSGANNIILICTGGGVTNAHGSVTAF